MNFNYFILFSSFIVIFCSVVYLLAYRERRKIVRSGNISYPGMSIVVPVWNEELTIAETLDSLLNMKNNYHGQMEIIVIYDHSTDSSYSIIEEYSRN
jgi:cellulose synthase/poly-beta-1,6-N-acetylglucosamine synthase-like glycosyltransferase